MKNLIYGKNVIDNIVKNFSDQIIELFILKGNSFDINTYQIIKEKNIAWTSLEKEEFFKLISTNINHQGFIASVKEFKYTDINSLFSNSIEKNVVLFLDKIQDPNNFGAIIRTASLFGVKAIVIQEHNQVQVTATVMKASAGTIYSVPIIRVQNLKHALHIFKQRGYWIYSSWLDNNSESIENIKFDNNSIIIVGNEGNGISQKLVEASDFKFKIKTNQTIDSLNVSVATGIILYEFFRK